MYLGVQRFTKIDTLVQKNRLMKFFYGLLISSALFSACCSSRKVQGQPTVPQGLSGYIREVRGNQMPSPESQPSTGKGLKTTVYIYELTNLSQVKQDGTSSFYTAISTKLIKTADTDENGYFQVALDPGSYSLFVKLNNKYYANAFDARNNIAVHTVQANKLTNVQFTVTSNATY